jgi:hypothetical protein
VAGYNVTNTRTYRNIEKHSGGILLLKIKIKHLKPKRKTSESKHASKILAQALTILSCMQFNLNI